MEQWKRWEPVNGIPTRIYNDSLVDSKEGLIITFSNETNTKNLIATFDGIVLSYRNTDEGSLLKMLNYLHQQYGTEFYSQWPLFKVENSAYLNWFLTESSGIYESRKVEHYVFLTPNDIIEVLSTYDPEIVIKKIS